MSAKTLVRVRGRIAEDNGPSSPSAKPHENPQNAAESYDNAVAEAKANGTGDEDIPFDRGTLREGRSFRSTRVYGTCAMTHWDSEAED